MEATRSRPRTSYTFKIPSALQADCGGIKEITMVELTAHEELLATKRSQQDPIRLAQELSRESFRYCDGLELSTANETSDIAWSKLGPKGRQLVMTAYARTHAPKNEELSDFLDSLETKVG
jgi:hypothetical protein